MSRGFAGRLRELIESTRRSTPLRYMPLTFDEIDALLDVVDAARAVVRAESGWPPTVDLRALKRLRDALGRVEG